MSKAGKQPSVAAQVARSRRITAPASDVAQQDKPIGKDECVALIGSAFAEFRTVVLAVSGGADSVALLHLAVLWRRAAGSDLRMIVATVDHQLRPEAAEEAAWVKAHAESLGLEHHTLVWSDRKPASGIQAAARDARYRLLAELASEKGEAPCAVAVGHHLDDQAETLLMRLGRGSGLDGLVAMPVRRTLGTRRAAGSPVMLMRPLLDVPKTRLQVTLLEAGIDWLEDPSNQVEQFERVKLRRSRDALASVGLVNAPLALSARRLRRALEALQRATRELEAAAVDYHDGAYAGIATAPFEVAAEELRLRLLQRVIERCGGGGTASLARLESLLERLGAGDLAGATLAGCRIAKTSGQIVVCREAGRRGLPEIVLGAGERAIWDGRFEVQLADSAGAAGMVRALGVEGWQALDDAPGGKPEPQMPRAALLSLPSLWVGGRVASVPHLGVENVYAQYETKRPDRLFAANFIDQS